MSAKKASSSSGLPLCDALASMTRPGLADYCAAAAEYIRTASTSTTSQQKIAQVQLSNALAAITLADLRERLAANAAGCRR
jgi:outer membrane usher protein FimD/PapC